MSLKNDLAFRLARLDDALSANAITRRIYPTYYARLKARRWLQRRSRTEVPHKFVFILCPPYAGSTLLGELLSTSPAVSCNNERGHREGQKLPEARPLMWDIGRDARWDEDVRMDWPAIRRIWMRYWDSTRPLLLEKSPPNLIRSADIEAHFEPAYFICMVRDPYVLCESIMRRSGSNASTAAAFVVRCMEHQRRNANRLRNALLVRYEDLGDNPEKTCRMLSRFIPELGVLDHGRQFLAHNESGKKSRIRNLNDGKLERISSSDLAEIGRVMGGRRETVEYFGYRLL